MRCFCIFLFLSLLSMGFMQQEPGSMLGDWRILQMRSSENTNSNKLMWDRFEKYPDVVHIFRFKKFGKYEYQIDGKTISHARYHYNPRQNSFYFKERKQRNDYKVKWLSDSTVVLDGWNNKKIKITLEKISSSND